MNALKKFTIPALAAMVMLLWACQPAAGTEAVNSLEDSTDTLSYLIGVDLAKNFQSQDLEIDEDRVAMGIRDVLGDSVKMDDMASQMFMMNWQMGQMKAVGDKARQDGAAFLAQKKAEPGVQEHESGLLYKVVKEGSGKSPAVTDQVTINYEGTLIDGTKFDSSYDRGQPATFGLSNLIQAWQIALPMMKEGGEWMIYAPDNLAYGDQAPPDIGPGQTLIFRIELIKVGG